VVVWSIRAIKYPLKLPSPRCRESSMQGKCLFIVVRSLIHAASRVECARYPFSTNSKMSRNTIFKIDRPSRCSALACRNVQDSEPDPRPPRVGREFFWLDNFFNDIFVIAHFHNQHKNFGQFIRIMTDKRPVTSQNVRGAKFRFFVT